MPSDYDPVIYFSDKMMLSDHGDFLDFDAVFLTIIRGTTSFPRGWQIPRNGGGGLFFGTFECVRLR